jgi:hypothetical protein
LADSSARQTIVFDFDQTIFAGDIGFEITHSRILRSPWRCALGLLLLPIYAPLFLHARSLRWGIGIAYWLSTVAARNDDQQVFFAVHGRHCVNDCSRKRWPPSAKRRRKTRSSSSPPARCLILSALCYSLS